MTFETKKREAVRQAFTVVELYLDINDPALDSEFANETDSYGTPKTTEDPRAYTGTDFRVYRYSDQQLFGVDHFPGVVKVASNPPKIDPGKSVGMRATAKVNLLDFNTNDTFELPSPYDDRRVEGSHFLKLFARNHLKNRRCRILRGFDPFNFDESNCQIENYIVDSFTFPDERGNVTLSLVDELILLESKKAKVPEVSAGELSADITAGATTLTFSTSVTDEYGAVSATGTIAIEKELMNYTVDSSTTMTVSRGKFGTEAAEHKAGETLQKCVVYEDENVIDIIEDIITNYTKIPASYIPGTDWAALKTDSLSLHNYTRVLFKPEDVKKVINDLIMLSGLSMYLDIVEREIKLVAIPDFSNPAITFGESEHILQGSLRIKRMEKEQITRQAIFWDKAVATETPDEKNFRKRFQVINGIVEGDADISNVSEPKPMKSEWLENSLEDNQVATSFAQRQVNRFSQVPIEVSFEIDQRHVGDLESGNRLWLGSTFDITTTRITDAALNPTTINCQCVSIKENKDRWKVTGLSYTAAAPIDADLYINEDKEDYLLTDELTTSEAKEYVVVINSGVTIGATSTANAAFRQGSFFAGATLKLVNLGQIIGAGGDGGAGPDTSVTHPNCSFGTAGNGSQGGDALDLTTDATIDNGFGLIGGGGGGGSGRRGICTYDSEIDSYVVVGGAGGGGGQGYTGGSGGSGGSASSDYHTNTLNNGATGPSGTIGAPGANGGELGEQGGSEQGGTGGLSGKAIETNGNTATITAGNNSEQLKGDVS